MVILLINQAIPQLLRLLFFSTLHAFEAKLSLLLFCVVNDRSLQAAAEATTTPFLYFLHRHLKDLFTLKSFQNYTHLGCH